MRKMPLITNELYHCFNRGTDGRNIFLDAHDLNRFYQSMKEFNTIEPIGCLRQVSDTCKTNKLVDFAAFCLNPNHYHFILQQLVNGGISEFMKRLGGGYTNFFNTRHKRSGVLFQGKFKSNHIDSEDSLLHIGVYVNLNDRVHQISGDYSRLIKSSWPEYLKETDNNFCNKNIILQHFKNIAEYKQFTKNAFKIILERKQDSKELKKLLLE